MKMNNYYIKDNHGNVLLDQRVVNIDITININTTPKTNDKKGNSPRKKYFGWMSRLVKGIMTYLTFNSEANQ